jgi:BirA family transcriptional regulator, biotin operon repressor / biotin---[acetyl-CoA-carboxylase] ligase
LAEKFIPEEFKKALNTRVFGQNTLYYEQIGSTNAELFRLAAERTLPEGTMALAEEQTAGRGRFERRWVSPAGANLLVSLLFRPKELPMRRAQGLTMLCSLAMADAVRTVAGLELELKWPNDLLLGGKKAAGVLTEVEGAGEFVSYSVVGLGLNVNVDFSGDEELESLAISLKMALGRELSRSALLLAYLEGVERRYLAWQNGTSPFEEWKKRLATLGKEVVIIDGEKRLEGLAVDVAEDGALLLRTAANECRHIYSGDVHLRYVV